MEVCFSSRNSCADFFNRRVACKPITGPSLLLQLPDELLFAIIEIVAGALEPERSYTCVQCPHCHASHTPYRRSLRRISHVCRRFRHMIEPLLFRNISLRRKKHSAVAIRSIHNVHRSLECNPHLRQYCRCLTIDVMNWEREYPFNNNVVACDYARWLTRTLCLSILGHLKEDSTWGLLQLFMKNCKSIEYLKLSSYSPVSKIFRDLNFPNMKWLELEFLYGEQDENASLETEKIRTASFTSLSLFGFKLGPQVLSQFIKWPRVLTRFEFDKGFGGGEHNITFPMLDSWLLPHSNTLTHVRIGSLLRCSNSGFFDATSYPNLVYLSLSAYNTGQRSSDPRTMVGKVLGPKLKVFRWDFSINDQHSERFEALGEAEFTWLRTLGLVAAEQKTVLETVEIQFEPEPYPNEYTEYPWDTIDAIQSENFGQNGMHIVYNEPVISKEYWMEIFGIPLEASEEVGEGPRVYHGEDVRKFLLPASGI